MFDRFNAWVGSLVKTDSGQTFVEYALVLSVIVVGVLLAATWLGLTGAIQGAINDVIAAF
jgi:Flp pilus assembly pilin Flp